MEMNELISNCNKCNSDLKITNNPIQLGTTPFVIIGESPAKDGWVVSGRAFYNTDGKLQASGRVLEKLLNLIGYKVSDIYFTEMCKCVILDRKKLWECGLNCLPLLHTQINSIPCKTILTMGAYPTGVLLGKKIPKLSDVVGKKFPISINGTNYTLIPIYHPSPLNPKGYSGNVEIFKSLIN